MEAKFYICERCGNLVTTIHNAGVPLVCCGEKMKELLPNTVEASGEKHLPVAELSGSTLTVTVGAVEHPMVDCGCGKTGRTELPLPVVQGVQGTARTFQRDRGGSA